MPSLLDRIKILCVWLLKCEQLLDNIRTYKTNGGRMMLHNEEKINEIVELLSKANDRDLEIALEFIRSLTQK